MAILNLCRICLIEAHRSKGMQPLFDDSNEQCTKIIQMIEECGGIMLKPLENYPRMICVQCLDALNASYHFRSMCRASENAILEALMRMDTHFHPKTISGRLIKNSIVGEGGGGGTPMCHYKNQRVMQPTGDALVREEGDEIYLDLRPEFIESHHVEFEELTQCKSEFEHEPDYVAIEDINIDTALLHLHNQAMPANKVGEEEDDQSIMVNNHDDSEDMAEDNEGEKRVLTTISIYSDTVGNNHEEVEEVEELDAEIEQMPQSNDEQSVDIKAELTSHSNATSTAILLKNKSSVSQFDDDKRNEGDSLEKSLGMNTQAIQRRKGRPPRNYNNGPTKEKGISVINVGNLKGQRRKRKTDSEPEANICEICGNIYTKRSILNMHMRRHRAEKPFECEICGKSFTCPSEISRHIRIHTGEKPYICRFCGRTFTDRSTNIKHERIHTNERPFTCQTCGKSFTYSNVLKNHILTHTGEKPFSCIPCNKTFSRKHQLDQHLATLTHRLFSKHHSKTTTEGVKNPDKALEDKAAALEVNGTSLMKRRGEKASDEEEFKYKRK